MVKLNSENSSACLDSHRFSKHFRQVSYWLYSNPWEGVHRYYTVIWRRSEMYHLCHFLSGMLEFGNFLVASPLGFIETNTHSHTHTRSIMFAHLGQLPVTSPLVARPEGQGQQSGQLSHSFIPFIKFPLEITDNLVIICFYNYSKRTKCGQGLNMKSQN